MKTKLDFLVIGAQKAGTTTLFEHLRGHPSVAVPVAKEIPYFSHEDVYRTSWSAYLEKAFPYASPKRMWGTVTPQYMVGGLYCGLGDMCGADAGNERTVPLRIRARMPEAKLVAILRDPVERAQSHHAMAILNGWERRSFGDAIADLLQPDALRKARKRPIETSGYVTWGEYGRILAGYVDVFGEDQLLVVWTDALAHRPGDTMEAIYDHIGVSATVYPNTLGRRYRTRVETRRFPRLDPYAAQAVAAHCGPVRRTWQALPPATRRAVDTAFSAGAYRFELWNRSGGKAVPAASDERLEALREHYRSDGKLLATLAGREPAWL